MDCLLASIALESDPLTAMKYITQIDSARAGKLTQLMRTVAQAENCKPEFIRDGIRNGTIVIAANSRHKKRLPFAIGAGLRIKVNTNIGTSPDLISLKTELEKLRVAIRAGTDAVMDLSIGGNVKNIRQHILDECPAALGTVPIYEAVLRCVKKGHDLTKMDPETLFEVIEEQAEQGVDFMTVHCGVTKYSLKVYENTGRLGGVVSRGGAITMLWMRTRNKENPLYEQYDRLLKIARKFDIVLSLGDGLRPGAIYDATDRAQLAELNILGELVTAARKAGVQVIVEGPGHIPLNQVQANVQLEKSICKGAPFYVLGPVVTDIAPGYDHITSSIGGAVAGWAGADFLCYVTPAEHLRLPTVQDVHDGVIAARIAAHAADIARGLPGARERDNKLSRARRKRDWQKQIKLSIDPEKAKTIRDSSHPGAPDQCTMCGDLCALKLSNGSKSKM